MSTLKYILKGCVSFMITCICEILEILGNIVYSAFFQNFFNGQQRNGENERESDLPFCQESG